MALEKTDNTTRHFYYNGSANLLSKKFILVQFCRGPSLDMLFTTCSWSALAAYATYRYVNNCTNSSVQEIFTLLTTAAAILIKQLMRYSSLSIIKQYRLLSVKSSFCIVQINTRVCGSDCLPKSVTRYIKDTAD